MKTRISLWTLFALLGIGSLALTGCYTQVGVTRDEPRDTEYAGSRDGNETDAVPEQTSDDEQRDDQGYTYNTPDWDNHQRVGYSYYYPSSFWPSYAFTSAYADPWYGFGGYNYWNGGCNYYGSWCGSSYLSYDPYWGYVSPYNSYWGYSYPYYAYPSYSYQYSYDGRNVKRGGRDIGSTRGSEDPRGISTGVRTPVDRTEPGDRTLPTGVRLGTSSGTSGRALPSAQPSDGTTRTGSGTQRVAPANGTTGTRGSASTPRSSTSRSGNSRVYRQRGGSTAGSSSGNNGSSGSSAPAYTPPTRDGGSSNGTPAPPRNPSPSYSPPPSSPPPSSGRGSAPASSGSSRSGSTRGGRPN